MKLENKEPAVNFLAFEIQFVRDLAKKFNAVYFIKIAIEDYRGTEKKIHKKVPRFYC